jgi:uncharacterized protein YecE (DUF72 family)
VTIRVGIGGWVYPPWRGAFYPEGLRQAEELGYASRHVTAIEINGTFYRLQKPDSYRKWHDETPEGFVFSLKGSRYISYRKEIASAPDALGRFLDSGIEELQKKLGPILWQFPPEREFDAPGLAAFLAALPKNLRHVVEVRHPSFDDPAFFDLLHEHRVAVAFVDDAKYPAFDVPTADFAYARLRRCEKGEPTGYSPEALNGWAARARDWSEGGKRDVFIYFINGFKVHAPAAAQALLQRLDGG